MAQKSWRASIHLTRCEPPSQQSFSKLASTSTPSEISSDTDMSRRRKSTTNAGAARGKALRTKFPSDGKQLRYRKRGQWYGLFFAVRPNGTRNQTRRRKVKGNVVPSERFSISLGVIRWRLLWRRDFLHQIDHVPHRVFKAVRTGNARFGGDDHLGAFFQGRLQLFYQFSERRVHPAPEPRAEDECWITFGGAATNVDGL